ncbi:MAG: hydrogenase iron-sulfur subunit [Thermoplasmata archaeon]|nr:MAG: hydrogenase iron-sulfur subunit [Thermoplasmata archaeon]
MSTFEPLIVGFVCNECVYAAADLAGTSRLSYPSNIRLIRVPCSGQVDMIHILRAFENGADGVFVGGCLPEQCHYVDGNEKAEARVLFLKKVLRALGLSEERLAMQFMSAAMGSEFARAAYEFTAAVRKLGPNPLKKHRGMDLTMDNKRVMLREMVLSIAGGLDRSVRDCIEPQPGFGEPSLDMEKCLGCGACAYVCKNDAMKAEAADDNVLLKHTYWRCTACGNCRDACPKECIEVERNFDLIRFLSDEEELKAEVGMIACGRCGSAFLPTLLASEMEKLLQNKSLFSSFLILCPTCRRFSQAERIRSSHGIQGEWKRRKAKGKSSA